MINIGNDWGKILEDVFASDTYLALRDFLKAEYKSKTVYPDMHDIFNALKLTSFSDTKIVILGQDPYHNVGQAHGMSFSVKSGIKPPPSLVNIFKEQSADLGIPTPSHGCLLSWAEQGVLLLNTILTVVEHQPMSHKNKGWELVTDEVITKLNKRKDPIIFLLWGAPAKQKKALITNDWHYILDAPHPSPLSAYYGFFGCKHFSKANDILKSLGKPPIDWRL